MITLCVQKLRPEAKLPFRKHDGDAAFDLSSTEDHVLEPGGRWTFGTGIAAEFPHGYVALFHDRSSMGAKGVHVLGGVIDPTYRGEWKVVLVNLSSEPVTISEGDRITQCIIQKVEGVTFEEVRALASTERGTGGFGSTGT